MYVASKLLERVCVKERERGRERERERGREREREVLPVSGSAPRDEQVLVCGVHRVK